MCISTTRNLMWIDERNHKSPVLSIAHHRNFDRTLRAETVSFGPCELSSFRRFCNVYGLYWDVKAPLTLLFSSVNSLVTVYDVNYGSSGYVHAYGGPSILFGSSSLNFPLGGSTLVYHAVGKSPVVNMFQLSSRGSLWRTRIAYSQDSEARSVPDSSEDLEWTEDMHTLAAKYTEAYEHIPPFGGREYLDANLRVAYESKTYQLFGYFFWVRHSSSPPQKYSKCIKLNQKPRR